VRASSLPFAVRDPDVRIVPAKQLWAMKRKAQARDHENAALRKVRPEAMLLLRPERLQGVQVQWPDTSLTDD
jgi:hypothetical protein